MKKFYLISIENFSTRKTILAENKNEAQKKLENLGFDCINDFWLYSEIEFKEMHAELNKFSRAQYSADY